MHRVNIISSVFHMQEESSIQTDFTQELSLQNRLVDFFFNTTTIRQVLIFIYLPYPRNLLWIQLTLFHSRYTLHLSQAFLLQRWSLSRSWAL